MFKHQISPLVFEHFIIRVTQNDFVLKATVLIRLFVLMIILADFLFVCFKCVLISSTSLSIFYVLV